MPKVSTILAILVAALFTGLLGFGLWYRPGPADASVPEIELPAHVDGSAGLPLVIRAKATGAVKWLSLDPGLAILPADLLRDPRATIAVATRPGRYRLAAWTALGSVPSDIAVTEIVIDGAPPVPPPPPPGPPPGPGPGPVPPIDPLAARLQSAYAADPSPAERKQPAAVALAGLYEAVAVHAADPRIGTLGDLLADYRAVAATRIVPGVLEELRKVVAAEIAASLPGDETQILDGVWRPKAVDCFRRLAMALGKVK